MMGRLTKSIILCYIVGCFGSLQCGYNYKIPPVIEKDTIPCNNYVQQVDGTYGIEQIYPENLYEYPMFNPENSDEFIYQKIYADYVKKGEIKSYNLSTGKSELICNEYTSGQSKWGKNNCFLFCINGKIYRKKKNIETLICLTPNGGHSPSWSGNNDYISYHTFMDTSYGGGGIRLIDTNGQVKENKLVYNRGTVCGRGRDYKIVYCFSGNNTQGTFADQIRMIDFFSNTPYKIIIENKDFPQMYVRGLCWNPINEDELFWTCIAGIFKTNIQTLQTIMIKQGCETKIYEHLDISSEGKKIIVQRWNNFQMPDTITVKSTSNIYIMDIDGSNEQKIILP